MYLSDLEKPIPIIFLAYTNFSYKLFLKIPVKCHIKLEATFRSHEKWCVVVISAYDPANPVWNFCMQMLPQILFFNSS